MLSPSGLILIAFIIWVLKVVLIEGPMRKRMGAINKAEAGTGEGIGQLEDHAATNTTLAAPEAFKVNLLFLSLDLNEVREWMDSAIIAAIIAFVIVTYVARSFIIPSSSMVPTLKPGDVIIVEKLSYRFSPIKRGDIVVFHPPIPNETRFFVKRVIGLPGDTVEVHDGYVYINGYKLDEPYIASKPQYEYGPVEVPDGMYFLLGDNRNNSYDSHAWDYPFVSRKLIEGRVFLRVFPLTRITLFRHPSYHLPPQAVRVH